MQANEITLNVDIENSGVGTVSQVYTRFEEAANNTTYVGDGHSLVARNVLRIYRTAPKATGNFLGTAKSSFKLTEDRVVIGRDGSNIVSPMIVEVSFSFPVGITAEQMVAFRQRALALLDNDGVMTPLNHLLMI